MEEKVLGSTTLARVVGAIGMPASSTVKKIEYYDFSVDPTDSSRIFFRGRLPNAQQPSQRCSMTFDAQGLVRTFTLEVLGEQPKGKEKNLINRVLQIMDENAPADGASSAPSAPAGRRIDYGAGYDPRNRPPAASSSSTAASSPAWSSAPADWAERSSSLARRADCFLFNFLVVGSRQCCAPPLRAPLPCSDVFESPSVRLFLPLKPPIVRFFRPIPANCCASLCSSVSAEPLPLPSSP